MTSHIYIITDGKNTKIGITTDLSKRISSYKTHNPNFHVYRTFEVNQKEAKRVEKVIIGAFQEDAVGEGKEWFSVDPKTIERYVTVLLVRDKESEVLPSMHEIPLTREARSLQEFISNSIAVAGTKQAVADARTLWQLRKEWRNHFGEEPAKATMQEAKKFKAKMEDLETKAAAIDITVKAGKDRMRELFVDRVGLGLPAHKVPEGTIRLGGLGLDWANCDPNSKIVRNAVRGEFLFPCNDHAEGFFHLTRLASGHKAALCTARVTMPYLSRMNDPNAWEEILMASKSMGWVCSVHNEWSWHSPNETGLILYQLKTPVREILDQWDGSFRRWVVERRNSLLMDAKGDKDVEKVLDDLASDNTFPMAFSSWDELLEKYFDRYWGFEMPDRFKDVYQDLVERWRSSR